MSNPTVTNIEHLNAMTGGDPDVIKQFIQMYLNDTPVLFQKLIAAYTNKVYTGVDSVQWCAHKIAPQLSYMGMEASYELARKIEGDIINSNLADLSKDVPVLQAHIEQSYIELNKYINTH